MPAIRKTNPHARRLRQEATDCEQHVWLEVRDRRLGGFKFKRQATIGPFAVDFLCAEGKLVVEIDGGQHNEENDAPRTRYIEARGYRVIRFWNSDVIENLEGVLIAIRAQLPDTPGTRYRPSPNPLPQAGEG